MWHEWLAALTSRLHPLADPPPLPPDLRPAAVLALIYPEGRELRIPLIERARSGGFHSGQLALPGGAAEGRDRDLQDTALRESVEEVGLDPHLVRMLGSLPPVHVTVSGFVVLPFIGWCEEEPQLRPSDAEVAAIVRVSLRTLADPSEVRRIPNPPGSLHPFMYEYSLPEGRLWGATARMLYSLVELIPPLA